MEVFRGKGLLVEDNGRGGLRFSVQHDAHLNPSDVQDMIRAVRDWASRESVDTHLRAHAALGASLRG